MAVADQVPRAPEVAQLVGINQAFAPAIPADGVMEQFKGLSFLNRFADRGEVGSHLLFFAAQRFKVKGNGCGEQSEIDVHGLLQVAAYLLEGAEHILFVRFTLTFEEQFVTQ